MDPSTCANALSNSLPHACTYRSAAPLRSVGVEMPAHKFAVALQCRQIWVLVSSSVEFCCVCQSTNLKTFVFCWYHASCLENSSAQFSLWLDISHIQSRQPPPSTGFSKVFNKFPASPCWHFVSQLCLRKKISLVYQYCFSLSAFQCPHGDRKEGYSIKVR